MERRHALVEWGSGPDGSLQLAALRQLRQVLKYQAAMLAGLAMCVQKARWGSAARPDGQSKRRTAACRAR